MSRGRKYLLWAGLGLVLLLGGAVALLAYLVSPEQVKSTLVPVLEQTLERQVKLASVEVSLFHGITVDNLEVRDPHSGEVQLTAAKVTLNYQFWPLLSRRIVIDEVLLQAPQLTLVRQPDGRFSTIGAHSARPQQAAKPTADQPGATAKQQGGLDLLVSEIKVEGGSVLFIDRRLNADAPFRYQLDDFNLTASQVALDKSFPVQLSGKIDTAAFELQGEVDLYAGRGHFKLGMTQLALERFAPYFRQAVPGTFSKAALSLALDTSYSPGKVIVNGEVKLSGVYLALDALPDDSIRDAELGLNLDLTADFEQNMLLLKSTRLRYNRIPLELNGSIKFAEPVAIDLALSSNKLELRDVISSLPAGLTRPLAGVDPAGEIGLKAQLQGGISTAPLELLRSADLTLNGLQFNLGDLRPSLSGPLSYLDNTVSATGLQLTLGDSNGLLDVKLSDLNKPVMQFATGLQLDSLNLDTLFPPTASVQADQGSGLPQSVATPAEPLGPYDLPLAGRGEVRIAELLARGVKSTDLQLQFHLQKNQLSIDALTGKVAGGDYQQTGTIDLRQKGLAYRSELQLQQAEAAPLLAAFASKLQGAVPGKLDFSSQVAGRGSDWETIKQQLVANGKLSLSQLQLGKTPLVTGLGRFLQTDSLQNLQFDDSRASFKVDKGRVEVDSDFRGSEMTVASKGTIGLNGELNLTLPVRLSPELAARIGSQGKLAALLVDQQGWTVLPLRLKGSYDAPEFKLDSKAVRNKAVNQLEQKLLQKLAPKSSSDKPADPNKQLLQDALKGLLGQ